VAKLNASLVKALAQPHVKEEFRKGAWEPAASTSAEFAAMLRTSYDQWGKLVAQVGYRKEQ
jgi:tripartite-type tricarboxylate transporter receptor subunit TctC